MRYKSINDIYSLFRRNRPISAVKCNNNKFYAVVQKEQQQLEAIQIQFQHYKTVLSLSMNYHRVNLDLSLTDLDLIPFHEDNIINYLLLLPELGKDGYINVEQNASYYVIDSEWNELGKCNNLYPPKSPECTY